MFPEIQENEYYKSLIQNTNIAVCLIEIIVGYLVTEFREKFIKKIHVPELHPVFVTSIDNQIYTVSQNSGQIMIFDNNGYFCKIFNKEELFEPVNIIKNQDKYYVIDVCDILIFNQTGERIHTWQLDGSFIKPVCEFTIINNELHVLDDYYGTIDIYDLNGKYLRSWDETFNNLCGIAVLNEYIYILDNFKIKIFDRSISPEFGKPIKIIDCSENNADFVDHDHICNFAITDETIYIATCFSINVYNHDGKFLRKIILMDDSDLEFRSITILENKIFVSTYASIDIYEIFPVY